MMPDAPTVINKWEERFLALAHQIARWSKDPHTGVGALIVGPARDIRATGYNGLPRRVDDTQTARFERPAKYLWTEHAERNAIYNAARIGTPLEGCTLYTTLFLCTGCARAVIQAGIAHVCTHEPDWQQPQWGEEWRTARQMLVEAQITLALYAPHGGIGQAATWVAPGRSDSGAQGWDGQVRL